MIQVVHDFDRFAFVEEAAGSRPTAWQRRIIGELRFTEVLSEEASGAYNGLIEAALSVLKEGLKAEGVLSNSVCEKAEQALLPLAEEAKSYEYLCAGHAHIDMNWMWGFHETTGTTVDTFRTMLQIMEEYPGFKFSQSQASVYRILERFAPEMLEEVKARVAEGRWELTASAWVETDKNMPSGESLSRHILYAKQYLSKLFSISPDSLEVDFDPDTFGHSQNIPEIASRGGVKYYYHCRGRVGEEILNRWRSPSGAELIIYTEPFWYNGEIDTTAAEFAPELARRTGSRTLLKVYGVGDHGGGPTRRDLDFLIEMNSWPVYPKFTFSTFHEYFHTVEARRETLPVIEGEINFLCDGCYTTQTRIKAGNRRSERILQDAELFEAASSVCAGGKARPEIFAEAWEKVLFNHFHDIIPGSGVTETREYASALYQEVAAAADSRRKQAFYNITSQMDTSALIEPEDVSFSRAEGGGAGFGECGYSAGKNRIFHLFNPSPWDRTENAEFVVWDYEGREDRMAVRDTAGNWLDTQKIKSGDYWGHHYAILAAEVTVPAAGSTAYIVGERPVSCGCSFINDMRVQAPETFVLENKKIRAEFSPATAGLVSLVRKDTGRELIPTGKEARFELATEAVWKEVTGWDGGMSAWFTGRQKAVTPLQNVELRQLPGGAVRGRLEMKANFGKDSTFRAEISLDQNSENLRFAVSCDWREFGSDADGIPCLQFTLPESLDDGSFLFDVPFGFVRREGREMDLPANRFVMAGDSADALILSAQTKYGYRCGSGRMAVTLIRGAYNPDPTPEIGTHEIAISVLAPAGGKADSAYSRLVQDSEHPLFAISGRAHKGTLPVSGSFLHLEEGSALLSACKVSEDGKALILRLYEADGKDCEAAVTFCCAPKSAVAADQLERPADGCVKLDGNRVSVKMAPYSVAILRVEL